MTRSAWRTPFCTAVAEMLSSMPLVKSANVAVEVAYAGAGPTLVILVVASTKTVSTTGTILPGGMPVIVTVEVPSEVTVPIKPMGA